MKPKKLRVTRKDRLDRQWYARCWRALYKHLLRWSDERIRHRIKNLPEAGDWNLTHEIPAYFVIWDMLSTKVRQENPGPNYNDVFGEIERALRCDTKTVLEFSATDWREARKRVNAVLHKYNLSLS